MAKKKERASDAAVRLVSHPIVLLSPHGGPAQLGTADDPIDVDADGRCTLDRLRNARLVSELLTLHGFTEIV